MLKFFRNKQIAKMVLWGLLILILPAFVLWGTGNLGGQKNKGPTSVGFIDNKKISFDDLAEGMTGVRCQVILNYFNQSQVMDILLKSNTYLATLAWDRLTMLKEAKKRRIRVSDKDVVNLIKSHPLFNRDGMFDDRIYQYALKQSMGLSPRAFEEIVRDNLAIQKLNDTIVKDVKIQDEEIWDTYEKDNEIFKLSYIYLDIKDFLDKALPDNNKAGELASKKAEESYKTIKETVDKGKLSFEEAAKKLGLDARETIYFSRYNKLENLGEGAAAKLADASRALKPGDISGPVRTRTGAVIFKVLEMQKPGEEKFKKNKDENAKKALDRKKAKFLEEWLRGLEKKARLNIDFKDYDKYTRQ